MIPMLQQGQLGRSVLAGSVGGGGGFPLTLPSLARWYDPSDASTVTLTSGKVSQLRDKSGNAAHAAPFTVGKEYSIATAGINGLDALTSSTGGRMNFNVIALPADTYYLFIVAAGLSATNTALLGYSESGNYSLMVLGTGTQLYSRVDGTETGAGAGTGNDGAAHIWALTASGSGSGSMHRDSATFAKSDGAGNVNGLGVYTSSGFEFKGNMGEVIIGTAALTSTQIADTKAYLKAKWGTP